jgi:hypothetical protein
MFTQIRAAGLTVSSRCDCVPSALQRMREGNSPRRRAISHDAAVDWDRTCPFYD